MTATRDLQRPSDGDDSGAPRRLPLFDDIPRSATEPKRADEDDFGYYNRSARVTIGRMRDVIDAYFEGFPADAASEVRQRFRSKDVVAHRSAVFEIVVHEVAMRVGCRLSAHPVVHGVTTHPDFLAEEPGDSPSFYLEAIVPGPSEDEAAAAKREAQVYALLDQMASPDFFLNVTIRGNPGTPVPTSKIRKMLAERMAALDRDEIASMPAEDVPRWPLEHDGWELEFRPVPKNAARGKAGPRTLGMKAFAMQVVNPEIQVRRAVEVKAKRYGQLDRPYVIAVNALDILTGRLAITEALLGDEVLDVVETAAGYHERPGRKINGAFGTPSRPRNQAVSSVLVFTPLRLDTLGSCKVRLYHHPWANRPYTGALTKCPQRAVRDGRYVDVDGVSLGDLLGLPPNWPEQAAS